MEIKNFLHRWW